jgi:transcriptional regulator GlxA family with amidase domain
VHGEGITRRAVPAGGAHEIESFREEFPELDVSSEVFEVDGERMTCSGGVAALDMMLQHVSEQHGHALAVQARISSCMNGSATASTTSACRCE